MERAMAQYIGVKQVTLTKPTIAQILEVEHEWQNDNPHADIRDLDLRIVGGSANERLVKVGHSHQPITGPQRSTERQLGTTPATSGRAELTPALGPRFNRHRKAAGREAKLCYMGHATMAPGVGSVCSAGGAE